MPTTFSTNGAVGKRTFGRGRGAPTGSIETTFRESKNLRDRNRSLDSEFQKNNEYFDKWYDSQSGDEGSIPTRSNYKTYPYDYFTGTNARIFFGDVWVDDIISINYSASQTKEPIYGYASQTFDAVARGVVTVQGSFSIAFKEMGYLNIIQRLLEKQRQGASAALDHKLDEIAEKAAAGKAAYEPRLASEQFTGRFGFSPTGQAQIVRKQDTIEDILMYKKGGNIIASGLGAYTLGQDGAKANRDFEDFAELMEDTIWGDSNGNPLGRNFQFRRVDEFDYRYDAAGNDLGGIITSKTRSGDDYSRVLNILLTFGDLNDFRAEHTLVALNDVHIVSESMIVAPTGEPIAVNYTFFARNINQTITQNLAQNIDPIKFEVGVDYEVSKIDDIEKIEGKLLDQEKPTRFEVEAIAKFRELDGWASIQPPDVLGIVQEEVVNDKVIKLISRNPWEPVIDQVIKVVEGSINNELAAWAVDTTYSQYVVKVKMTNSSGNLVTGNDITMVLEQRIPNTHTYRVISPTRQNFRAPQVFTRDDLWATIPPPKDPGEKEPNPNVRNAGDTATVSTLKGKLYTTDAFGNKIEVPLDELGTPIDVNPLDKTEGLSSFPTGEAAIIAEARADELGLTGVDRELFIAQEELRALEEQERRNAQTNTSSSTTSTPTGSDIINEQEQQYIATSEEALVEADNLGLTGEEREEFITQQLSPFESNSPVNENITQRNQEESITLPQGVRLNSAGEPINEEGFLVDPVTGDPVQFANAGTSDIYIDYGLRRYIENPDGTVSPLLPAQNAVNETYNGPLKRVDLTETPANVAETAFSSSNDAFIVARGEHHRIDPLHEASFQQNVSAIDFAPRPGETLVVGAFREGVITDIQPDAILVRTESGETDVYVHGLPLEGITKGTRISQDQAFYQTTDHLDYRVKAQNGRLLFNDQAVEERAIQGLQRQGYDVTDVVDYYAKDRQARIEEYQRNNLNDLLANTTPE